MAIPLHPPESRKAPKPERPLTARFPATIELAFASAKAMQDFIAKATSTGGTGVLLHDGSKIRVEL